MSAGADGASAGDFLASLRARAGDRRRTLVYPEGTDPRVLDAVARLVADGTVDPVVIGEPGAVRDGLRERAVNEDHVRVLDPRDPALSARSLSLLRARRPDRAADDPEGLAALAADPLVLAGTLVAEGDAHGAVAGCVRTSADVIRAGLTCLGLREGLRTLSSAFYMVFGAGHPAGPSVLTFTDAGVVPTPDADRLADIAEAAALARTLVVGDEPRVAFLSYSTKGSAEGPSVTLAREALARFRARLPDIEADGELQADAALSEAVAARKAPGSSVGGRANVLVFPDLASANIAYKLVQHLGGAVALGPVLQGLRKPYSDLSRGASAADIAAVSCITALMSD